MYSTCLFCHHKFGGNEAVEHFPIGRRLAFDSTKGRLWVVCRKCERWNLTPIEERWDAIEECERAFRSTKMRVSTDEIGLARLSEGLELVRIGKPQRPEFAAWRYGDQFGRRRRMNYVKGTAAFLGFGIIPLAGMVSGVVTGSLALGALHALPHVFTSLERNRIVARVHGTDGTVVTVKNVDLPKTVLYAPTADKPWGLGIVNPPPFELGRALKRHKQPAPKLELRGDAAIKAAGQLLPGMNDRGGTAKQVRAAVDLTIGYGGAQNGFDKIARLADTQPTWKEWGEGAMLASVPEDIRLALEMLSHEDAERYALEVDLETLKDAWREAEEIAAIADNLFVPGTILKKLAELRGQS
ncbi:MAG TPA: hypothetical protein VM166_01230 [Gemmatimonadaceae bacterium]|nr:hypothetical protein [Gemmatimonadaceae bacterium]